MDTFSPCTILYRLAKLNPSTPYSPGPGTQMWQTIADRDAPIWRIRVGPLLLESQVGAEVVRQEGGHCERKRFMGSRAARSGAAR